MSEEERAPRRRPHALELTLADEDDRAVRALWAQLHLAGIPSPARHRGATHRPHLTLVSGPAPPTDVLDRAAELVAPLLPLDLPVAGLLRFAGRRGPVVELVTPPLPVLVTRDALLQAWPEADDRPWVPHLTLATRPDDDQAARAVRALGELRHAPTVRTALALRWWDPDRETVTELAGEAP